MAPVYLLAEFLVKKDKLDEFKKHVKALREHAEQKEPGTLHYLTTVDPENPYKFVFFEKYESPEQLQHHKDQPPFQAVAAVVSDLVEEGQFTMKLLDQA